MPFKVHCSLIFIMIFTISRRIGTASNLTHPELILSNKELNDIKNLDLWKIGSNSYFKDKDIEFAKSIMGTILPSPEEQMKSPIKLNINANAFTTAEYNVELANLPTHYDIRDLPIKTKCPTFTEIFDQGNCGSCWAASSMSALSDRVCISTNGAYNKPLSVQEVTSCCGQACAAKSRFGCNGGTIKSAFDYAYNNGVPSGGNYQDRKHCYSYEYQPCAHTRSSTKYPDCTTTAGQERADTPECRKSCNNNESWENDRIYSKSKGYQLVGEIDIMKDILKNGPIAAGFKVYRDFLFYQSGIYSHPKPDMDDPELPPLGAHAVKIIGWGEEEKPGFDEKIKYWICVNSWNEEWGESGTFRIRRGVDECEIETSAAYAAKY